MPMPRRFRVIVLTVALLLALGGRGLCGILPDAFRNWGGSQFLDLVQSKINGKITAREVSGNPLTGFTYKDVVLTGPQGRVILQADRLELRLSLETIPALYPVVARLALVQPHFYLVEEDGRWNFSRLAPPPAPGPPPPGPGGMMGFFLRQVDFTSLLVEQGAVEITRDGVTRRYSELDLKAALNVSKPGTPQQNIDLKEADLGLTTPWGRAGLNTRLTYAPGLARIDHLALTLAGQGVLSLKGEICEPLKDLTCKLTGRLGPLQGEKVHEFWSRWPAPWDLAGKFSFSSTPQGMELAGAGGVGEAQFDLKGRLQAGVKPGAFELDLNLKGLATAQLQEIEGLEARKIQGLSPVNAHLSLKGQGLPWNPEEVRAELNLEPFQYREVKVKRLELTLSGNAQSQDLHALAEGNFGALTLDSRGRLLPVGGAGPGASGDLTLKMAEFQPALLGVAKYPGHRPQRHFYRQVSPAPRLRPGPGPAGGGAYGPGPPGRATPGGAPEPVRPGGGKAPDLRGQYAPGGAGGHPAGRPQRPGAGRKIHRGNFRLPGAARAQPGGLCPSPGRRARSRGPGRHPG